MADRYDAGANARAAGGIPVAGVIGPPSGGGGLALEDEHRLLDVVTVRRRTGSGEGRLGAAVLGVGPDGSGDDQLGGVDVLRGERLVQHAGVGALRGEGDRGTGPVGVGAYGAAAVDEQQGAAAEGAHAGQHGVHGCDGSLDGEGQGRFEVVGARVEDRLHEVGAGHGAVLEDLDGSQRFGGLPESRGEGNGVQDIGGEAVGPDTVAVQLGGQLLQLPGVAGDEGHGVAGGSEAAGGGESEAGAGSDEGKGGHDESFCGAYGSGLEEGFDGAALVHRPVPLGDLFQGQGEVEDLARLDPAGEDPVERTQVATVRMIASVGLMIFKSSSSSKRTSPGEWT